MFGVKSWAQFLFEDTDVANTPFSLAPTMMCPIHNLVPFTLEQSAFELALRALDVKRALYGRHEPPGGKDLEG